MRKINRPTNTTKFLGSLLILWALSWCALIEEQTSTEVNWIMWNKESNSSADYLILEKERIDKEDFEAIWYKKWDWVLVLYRDNEWRSYITQEQYSEKHFEYRLVNGKQNWNHIKVFLAWKDDEFDIRLLVTDKKIEVIS